MNYKEIKVHFIEHIKSKNTGTFCTLQNILDHIKNGSAHDPEFYSNLRSLPQPGKEYNRIKTCNLKAWLPCAIFRNSNTFVQKNIESLTGLMYFDADFKDDRDPKTKIENLLAKLKLCEYVIAAWRSAGGKGLGWLIHIDNLNNNISHRQYEFVYKKVASILFPWEIDMACCKPERKNCISYDPNIYINAFAKSFSRDISFFPDKSNQWDSASTPNQLIKFVGENTLHKLNGGHKLSKEELKMLIHQPEENVPPELLRIIPLRKNWIEPEECIDGKQYKIFEYGKLFYYSYNKYGKKTPEGKRTRSMFSKIVNVLFNNIPLIERHGSWVYWLLYNRLTRNINDHDNQPPIPEFQLSDMFIECIIRLQNGTLFNKNGKIKRLGLSSEHSLTGRQIQGICAREFAIERGKKTKEKILKNFFDYVRYTGGFKPTQIQMLDMSDIKSINTIAKHWTELLKIYHDLYPNINKTKLHRKILLIEILPLNDPNYIEPL